MPMMMSQISKSVDLRKTQKSRYLGNKILSFLQTKRNHKLHIKGYFTAKNSFVVEISFKGRVCYFFASLVFK